MLTQDDSLGEMAGADIVVEGDKIAEVGRGLSADGARESTEFFSRFDAGGTHADWLTPAELRLIAEWLDIGGQYYNDPFMAPVN